LRGRNKKKRTLILNTMKKTVCALVLAGAMLFTSCGSKGLITKGSSSKLDSLSYAWGVSIGSSWVDQLPMPIDIDEAIEGITDGAYEKGRIENSEAFNLLQDYFMNKRMPRMRAIMQKRHEADSIRLAQGDSTKVEYPRQDPDMFESEQERKELSYALGLNTGYSLTELEIPLQTYWIAKGIEEVADGNSKMDARTSMMFVQDYMMVQVPARNKELSEKWLAEVEKQRGVQKTESGLLYRIEKEGDMSLKADDPRDVVRVHYKGTKRSGKVFDASRFADMPKERQEMMKQQLPEEYDKDEPVEFPLNRVIKGWTEGMQLVGKGGKITLWIPSDLAYGPRGNRGIGGNEALRFDVELIDVLPYEEPQPAELEEAPEAPAAAETK